MNKMGLIRLSNKKYAYFYLTITYLGFLFLTSGCRIYTSDGRKKYEETAPTIVYATALTIESKRTGVEPPEEPSANPATSPSASPSVNQLTSDMGWTPNWTGALALPPSAPQEPNGAKKTPGCYLTSTSSQNPSILLKIPEGVHVTLTNLGNSILSVCEKEISERSP